MELRPGSGAWIDPRGVWHRAEVLEPAEMLLVTAGRGTQHRPVRSTSDEPARASPEP